MSRPNWTREFDSISLVYPSRSDVDIAIGSKHYHQDKSQSTLPKKIVWNFFDIAKNKNVEKHLATKSRQSTSGQTPKIIWSKCVVSILRRWVKAISQNVLKFFVRIRKHFAWNSYLKGVSFSPTATLHFPQGLKILLLSADIPFVFPPT